MIAAVETEPLFDRDGWWHPASRAFASLRSVSEFRLQLLQEWLGGAVRGRTIVDLGCGGGLLAVPLVRLGARVVGVDLAMRALRSARATLCPGDFDHDGYVNGNDYDAFAEFFESGDPGADVNHDGYVNGNDYDLFAGHFEEGC